MTGPWRRWASSRLRAWQPLRSLDESQKRRTPARGWGVGILASGEKKAGVEQVAVEEKSGQREGGQEGGVEGHGEKAGDVRKRHCGCWGSAISARGVVERARKASESGGMVMPMVTRLFLLACALPRFIFEGSVQQPLNWICSKGRTGSCGPWRSRSSYSQSVPQPFVWKHPLRTSLRFTFQRPRWTVSLRLGGLDKSHTAGCIGVYLMITSSSSSLGFPTALTASPTIKP